MRTVTWLGGPFDGKEVAIKDDDALTVSVLAPCGPSLSIEKPEFPETPPIHHCPLRRSTDGRWWAVWHE